MKKRMKILTEIEVDELFSAPTLSINDQRFFFTLNDAELAECEKIRDRKHRCMFVLLLGYFKVKPVILNLGFHQAKKDLKYITEEIFPGAGFRPFNLTQNACWRLYQRILKLADYQRWNSVIHSKKVIENLEKAAHTWIEPRALFDCAIEYLSKHKIAIPGYTVLQDLISDIVTKFYKELTQDITQLTSEGLVKIINQLSDKTSDMRLSHLRQSAKNFTGSQLEKELAVYKYLYPWFGEIKGVLEKLTLSPKNKKYFAERIDYYGAKLKYQPIDKQHLYLLCYFEVRFQQALERIADGFIHHLQQTKQKAKLYAQEVVYANWQNAATNVSKAATILHFFIDDDIDQQESFSKIKKRALELLAAKELEDVCLFLNAQKRSVEEAKWQYYDKHDSIRTDLLRKLFLCLQFEGCTRTKNLAATLNKARASLIDTGHVTISASDELQVPKKHIAFLEAENGIFNAARYEWYLYLQVPKHLNGELTLPDIIKYRSLDADLVSAERWEDTKNQLIEQSQLDSLTADPNTLISELTANLDHRLQHVSNYLDETDNRNIILRNTKGKHIWRLSSEKKNGAVNNPFFQQMPITNVADVLHAVDRDTGFIDCFKHVLGLQSQSRLYEQDLIAILTANATNHGIYGIAQISDRSYDSLSTIQANYLRLETLSDANDCINAVTAKLPIFKYYNIQEDIIHASADGQKFEVRRETFKTRYSSKYFGTQKGVSALSLIANHAAVNARIIGANEHESHYILDLLLSNTSEIVPDMLSTDTHGANHVNFALLDLFGYGFAPRYAQIGKVLNEMFNVREDENDKIQLTLKKPINIKCITQHWDTIRRIVISLKERKTTQATLVRKLSGYKKNHPLLEALAEYNRMIKANYLLNYIDNKTLRHHVQCVLNRGEAYHQLRRAISNVNGNQFRGNSDEEIALWNECARLVTNAIIYFNSSILSRLLVSFEYQQNEKKIAIVKRASPVAWYNINFKGTYRFSLGKKTPDIEALMQSIDGYITVKEK